MEHEILPIGTVVELKNSTTLVMIGGYLSIADADSEKVWDYSGFFYPIGYVNNNEIISFDHDQIETVIAYGYRDIEEESFTAKVRKAKEELDARHDAV